MADSTRTSEPDLTSLANDFDIVGELPKKNIDTGLGMERLAMILQGVENMYETDQVRPVIDKAAELSGREYTSAETEDDPHHTDDVRMRVVRSISCTGSASGSTKTSQRQCGTRSAGVRGGRCTPYAAQPCRAGHGTSIVPARCDCNRNSPARSETCRPGSL